MLPDKLIFVVPTKVRGGRYEVKVPRALRLAICYQ